MPKLKISKPSIKFLMRLPSKHAKQIEKKLEKLKKVIHPHDSKFLKSSQYFRVDSGKYKIIYRYTSQDDSTWIVLIVKRNDDEIYQKLDRLNH